MPQKVIPFRDLKLHRQPVVAVVGAGPSLNRTKDQLKDYPVTIGVNYTYELHPVDYLVVTHMMQLIRLKRGEISLPRTTRLIYSEYASDWLYMGAKNPKNAGIVFREYMDLQCGASTIVSAIDFATRLSSEVHLFGVDLSFEAGQQYADGYRTPQTQTEDFFRDWARIVQQQIAGLQWRSGSYLKFVN